MNKIKKRKILKGGGWGGVFSAKNPSITAIIEKRIAKYRNTWFSCDVIIFQKKKYQSL